MKKLILIILISLVLIGAGCGKDSSSYYLNPENTISVTADEYHFYGSQGDYSYKAGEWTSNLRETYANLIKVDMPNLEGSGEVILHLKVEAFSNKNIWRENCSVSKKFYIKRLNSDWNAEDMDYGAIKEIQEKGTVIGEFTISPDIKVGSYITVNVPAKDLVGGYGFTIDQADESFCRVSFYSHNNKEESQPYITTN